MTPPAVVIAAGVGRRLRPLTAQYAKPLLPIDGRPVLGAVLGELAAANCPHVTLVTGYLAEQVERFAGDGSAWDLTLSTVRQARPDGSADAVVSAAPTAPYLVVGADTLFAPGEIARFAASFESSGAGGALAVCRRGDNRPGRNGVAVENGRLTGLGMAGSPFAGAPLWAVGPALAAIVATLPGAAPFELATAFEQGLAAGEHVAAIEIEPTRDLTTPADLLSENFPYLHGL